MKQLEDLAKRIDETGEENSTVSGLIYAFANKYMKIINKISTALKSQTSVLGSITSTVTNAAISADKIGTTLGDINTTDFILKQYESYNDYDGMNWLRDILFE
jgi:methyl-accepting chemotaxis protein